MRYDLSVCPAVLYALSVCPAVLAHWGMFSPPPDFGKHNWDECRTPSDALIGDGDCNWFAMRGAYWFSAGTQIGCKNVTGSSCDPPFLCCDTIMEPTNNDPDLLTFPTWENLSKRVPFPYNLLTTEEAWLNAADASSAKGSHIYFRGDTKWAPISKYNPWRAPGFAPILDACGVHGGYPWPKREMFACGSKDGEPDVPGECWKTGPINAYEIDAKSAIFGDNPNKKMQHPPGTSGTTVVNNYLKKGEGSQANTKWVAGGTAEVSQGYWESNHGGGYMYRLCAEKDFTEDGLKNEDCFQATPLDYASENSWVEYGAHSDDPKKKVRTAFGAIRVNDGNTKGVKPAGSTWTKMQIPTCLDSLCESGVYAFKPPVPGLFSGMNWYGPAFKQMFDIFPKAKGNFELLTKEQKQLARDTYDAHADYVIIDKVRVPKLPKGRYVLSWRWDAEHSAQVWANCAVIEIVESLSPEQPAADTKRDLAKDTKSKMQLDAVSETAALSVSAGNGNNNQSENMLKSTLVAGVGATVAAVGVLLGVVMVVRRSDASQQQDTSVTTPASIDVLAM